MLAIELVEDRATKAPAASSPRRPSRPPASAGSLLLACGLYANVIRILVPLVVSDEELERGLDALEESLASAADAGAE